MSVVFRPFVSIYRAIRPVAHNAPPIAQLSEQVADHFELNAMEPAEVQLRLAHLRSREAHLEPQELAELFDLNEAQRLQHAIEHNALATEDVREAARLSPLRQAFATQPEQHGGTNTIDQFRMTNVSPQETRERLAHLRSREGDLSSLEQVELSDLNEAQRLQRKIEQGTIAPDEIRDAERLAHLRRAFENTHTMENAFSATSSSSHSLANHSPEALSTAPPASTSIPASAVTEPAAESNALWKRLPGNFINLQQGKALVNGLLDTGNRWLSPVFGFFGRLFSRAVGRSSTGVFTPVCFEDLFGHNPRQVTMSQGYSATCHTLAPLHSILNHPQAREILGLIRYSFNSSRGVYRLELPNREAIEVPLSELNNVRTNAQSSHIGVPLLEAAFLRAASANPHRYNSAAHALTTLLGESRNGGPGVIRSTVLVRMQESLARGMYDARARVADIWVAAPQHARLTPGSEGNLNTGGHYYGLSLSPDRQELQVFNPVTPPPESGIPKIYHLPPVAQALHENEHNQPFMPELIQIQL